MSKRCIKCGMNIAEDDLFCGSCGAKQEQKTPKEFKKHCIKCGVPLADDDFFCVKCGTKQELSVTHIDNNSEEHVVERADGKSTGSLADDTGECRKVAAPDIEMTGEEKTTTVPVTHSYPTSKETTSKNKPKKIKLLLGIIVAVVIAVVAIVVALSSGKSNNPVVNDTPTNTENTLGQEQSFNEEKNSTEVTIDNQEENIVSEFLDMAGGIWVDLASSSSFGEDAMFAFCGIEDGGIYTASYPGGGSRTGKIVKVDLQDNKRYVVTLYYPEEEWMGDFYKEEYVDCELIIDANTLVFADFPETVYTFMGKTFEEARTATVAYCADTKQIDLQTGNLPYLFNLQDELSLVLDSFYNNSTYGIQNYTAHDQRGSALLSQYEDYVIALNYGPNSLVLMNASIKENIVQSMSASIDLGSGCLYNDYDQLEHLSKTALLPAALLFKGNDKAAIIDQLWSEMKVSSVYDENDYYNTTYQYLTDDLEISITHHYYDGKYSSSSSISFSAKISSSRVSAERSTQEYISALNEHNANVPTGSFNDWEYTSESNKYKVAINLMQKVLLNGNLLKSVDFMLIEDDYREVDNYGFSNYFFEIKTHVDNVFTYLSEVGIYFYVTGDANCVTYRVYDGPTENENYEYWSFDWNGNQIESSSNVSMAEHTYNLLYH